MKKNVILEGSRENHRIDGAGHDIELIVFKSDSVVRGGATLGHEEKERPAVLVLALTNLSARTFQSMSKRPREFLNVRSLDSSY